MSIAQSIHNGSSSLNVKGMGVMLFSIVVFSLCSCLSGSFGGP